MEIVKQAGRSVFGSGMEVNADGVLVMDSRAIAEEIALLAEIEDDVSVKTHAHICRDIRRQLEVQKIDQSTYGSIFLDSYGREQTCFKLDYEQTMILVSGYSISIRAKIIKRWQELEKLVGNQVVIPSYQIADPIERAKVWIEEQKETILLKNKMEEQQPKVEFYDTVTDSSNTIEMGEVAKVLNHPDYGRNNLFEFLRQNNVLMKNNQPYQKYVDAGYFRVIETTIPKPNGDVIINLKTVVYQKGVDYIRKLIFR